MDQNKLKNIKAIAFDADGVLFTGRVFVGQGGEIMKERSHIDGHGLSLIRSLGIKIVFVTAEKSIFLERVMEKLNSLDSVKNGKWDKIDIFTGEEGKNKVKVVDGWLKNKGISWNECAAMGDDLTDYQLLKASGFAAAPAQAEEEIKKISDYVTKREGGNGAIRDFCNLILNARGVDLISL